MPIPYVHLYMVPHICEQHTGFDQQVWCLFQLRSSSN